jgi:hypothetical protein
MTIEEVSGSQTNLGTWSVENGVSYGERGTGHLKGGVKFFISSLLFLSRK